MKTKDLTVFGCDSFETELAFSKVDEGGIYLSVVNKKLRITRRKRADAKRGDGNSGISPVDISAHNSRAALELLRRLGACTRLELSNHLQLTEPAIAGIMSRLLEAGYVSQNKRGGGRYVPMEYVLNAGSANAIGIQLSSTEGRAVLMDLSGAVLDQKTIAAGVDLVEIVSSLLSVGERRSHCRGIAIASHDGTFTDLQTLDEKLAPLPVRFAQDTETAIFAERVFGVGAQDGGFVVILIKDSVRAGLFVGGKPFKGEHGQAGNIGGMSTGKDRICLNDAVSGRSFASFMASFSGDREDAVRQWTDMAANHLKDAIIAIGGFLSPGLILVGGELPEDVLNAMIDKVNHQMQSFIASFSVPTVRSTSFPGGGGAEGAAISVLVGDLLPDLSQMGQTKAD